LNQTKKTCSAVISQLIKSTHMPNLRLSVLKQSI